MSALTHYVSKVLIGVVLLLFLFTGISLGLCAAAGVSPVQQTVAASSPAKLFEWRPFLAPFHSVVLHLPIGFFLIAFLLELYSIRRSSAELRKVIGFVLILSVLSALVTIGLGFMRGTAGEYDEAMLNRHRWFGIAVGAISLFALFLHWLAVKTGGTGGMLWCYRLVALANLFVLVLAGHEGGNLTHGSAYLVKNAPEFVKTIWDEFEDVSPEEIPSVTVAHGLNREYVEKVRPIFESKCLSCHGPEKQKGAYRLDQEEIALRGGDSGEIAIKPGAPLESRLIKLILLPADHDDIMPPSGKETLGNDELITLIRWVQNGAHFTEKRDAPELAGESVTAKPTPANEAPPVPVTESAVAKSAEPPRRISEFPRSVDFIKDIKPVFEGHCLACHGSEKQKSRLRLDQKQLAFAGGRHGSVIVPGHAEESELYLRISTPPDRDPSESIMPPEHKNLPLTANEIAAIGGWIDSGAHWPDGVVLSVRKVPP